MAKKEVKTNAMRILDRMKIPYTHQAYECDEFVDGIQTADNLGLPHTKRCIRHLLRRETTNNIMYLFCRSKQSWISKRQQKQQA